TFTANEGDDAIIDLRATGDMDARLVLFSENTGSWFARNDDRSLGDVDPLIDAPIFAEGPALLVVENIAESVQDLGYTMTARSEL
ncbi:MAG: hypothetical protein ACNA8W_21820, partial [Bradymonadaceae bacterium]